MKKYVSYFLDSANSEINNDLLFIPGSRKINTELKIGSDKFLLIIVINHLNFKQINKGATIFFAILLALNKMRINPNQPK